MLTKEIKVKESLRTKSLSWFNSLSLQIQKEITEHKRIKCHPALVNISLTGREIEEVYIEQDIESKTKGFDKSLFKEYVSKLSDKEKIEAFEILFNLSKKWDGIDNSSPFYMSICRAYNAGKKAQNQRHSDNNNQIEHKFISSDEYFKEEFGF